MQRVVAIWSALALMACASSGSSGGSNSGTNDDKDTPGKTGKEAIQIPDGDDNLVPLSQHPATSGVTFGGIAAANDEVLYVCTGATGLYVATLGPDFTLKTIVEQASLELGAGCRELAVSSDGTVFVTGLGATTGSWIASFSNVPSADGTIEYDATVEVEEALVEDMVVSDTHVFLALGSGGVRIFGRNDGGLAEVGRVESMSTALGISQWGNDRLVVANGQDGLTVLDISDPTAPVVDKQMETFGTARRVEVAGDLAWVAGVTVGVAAYDLTSDKKKPRVGSWPTHASTQDISVSSDGKLYVANWEDLVVLDISDHKDIKFLGSDAVTTADGSSSHVVSVSAAAVPGVAYVAEWTGYWTYYFAEGRTAPDIRISRNRIDFGVVKSGFKGKGLNIDNLGEKSLEITGLKVDDPQFELELDYVDFLGDGGSLPAKLEPGETGFLQVKFTVVNWEEETKANLVLLTNDPDEGEIKIPLTANVFDSVQIGGPFKSKDDDLVYIETKTGNEIMATNPKFAGKVVVLAYFATW